MSQVISELPHWYVIHTHPKQEYRADRNLRAWRVETFAPKCRERRYNRFTGRPDYFTGYLFPRYIFARFRISDLLAKVRLTRGVHAVVTFGDLPTPLDDEIIDFMKSRCNENGLVRLPSELRTGDEVVIESGLFTGFTGIFEQEMKDSDRVMILLKAVSYQTHVVVSRQLVKKAGESDAAFDLYGSENLRRLRTPH